MVPGLGFYVRGEKRWGKALVCCGAVLAMSFLIWIGYPLANVAFGLLLSLHVSSFLFLFKPLMAETRLPFRVALSLALLIVISQMVYAPLRHQLQEHWVMPLRAKGTVVVVHKGSDLRSVKCGEWIAYSLSERAGEGLSVAGGFGLGPVLAVAGDHLQFKPEGLEVNGILQPPLAHLPSGGEIVVPEKHWFLWPELSITGHGHLGEPNISSAMLQLAIVSEAQFVGKPYRWWFWRRQHFL